MIGSEIKKLSKTFRNVVRNEEMLGRLQAFAERHPGIIGFAATKFGLWYIDHFAMPELRKFCKLTGMDLDESQYHREEA